MYKGYCIADFKDGDEILWFTCTYEQFLSQIAKDGAYMTITYDGKGNVIKENMFNIEALKERSEVLKNGLL